jgi:hypothetical protein
VDLTLKILPCANAVLCLIALIAPSARFRWWDALVLLGIGAYFGITSYYAVHKFTIRSTVEKMPLLQRVWLDESAHAAAIALIFFFLQVTPWAYFIGQLVAFCVLAWVEITGTTHEPNPLQRVAQKVGGGTEDKYRRVKRFYSAIEVLVLFWLFGATIGRIFSGGALRALIALVAYFLLNTCFGLASIDDHEWLWGQLDDLVISHADKLGSSVSDSVKKVTPSIAKVQDIAKSLYSRSFIDRVTN